MVFSSSGVRRFINSAKAGFFTFGGGGALVVIVAGIDFGGLGTVVVEVPSEPPDPPAARWSLPVGGGGSG